jgi:phosphoribosylformylglycinamidine (FGAM) synthase-like enzyme
LSRGRPLADVALFNQSQSRSVITFAPRHASEILDFLNSRSVPHTRLGEVTKSPTLTIETTGKTFA